MRGIGKPVDVITYNSLLHALCKNHQLDKEIALVKEFKDQGFQPNVHSFTTLIDGLWKSGRLKNAQVIFQELMIEGCHITVWMYNGVRVCLMKQLPCYQEKDERDKAKKLLCAMIVKGPLKKKR